MNNENIKQGTDHSRLLAEVCDNIPYYVFWKDKNLIFRGCNKLFARQFGYDDPSEIIGKTDDNFPWPESLKKKYNQDDLRVINTGESLLNIEESQTQEDGSIKTVLVNKTPLYNSQGEIDGILGFYTDITERKKLDEALRELREREAHFKALSAMGGMIAHELRTPLTALKASTVGMTKSLPTLLKAHDLCAARHEIVPIRKDLLEGLQRSVNNMDRLIKRCQDTISAVLNGIKYSTDKTPTTLTELSLAKVVEKAILDYPMSEAEKEQLSVELDDVMVKADESILVHVLHNLLKNAFHIIYEEGCGKVLIRNEVQNGQIKLIVEDTAKGIPPEELAHIFDAFYTTKKKAAQSVGLGLYFCRTALIQMGATISCESEPGHYTRFIITLLKK